VKLWGRICETDRFQAASKDRKSYVRKTDRQTDKQTPVKTVPQLPRAWVIMNVCLQQKQLLNILLQCTRVENPVVSL